MIEKAESDTTMGVAFERAFATSGKSLGDIAENPAGGVGPGAEPLVGVESSVNQTIPDDPDRKKALPGEDDYVIAYAKVSDAIRNGDIDLVEDNGVKIKVPVSNRGKEVLSQYRAILNPDKALSKQEGDEEGNANILNSGYTKVQDRSSGDTSLAELRAINEEREAIRSGEDDRELLASQNLDRFEREGRDQNYERAIADIQDEAEHTERLLARQERAEARLAKSELGIALRKSLEKAAETPIPPKMNLIRRVYVKYAYPDKYKAYTDQKENYENSKNWTKRYTKLERQWVKKEEAYLAKADLLGTDIQALFLKLENEGLTKREAKKLHKLTNSLTVNRMAIDNFFLNNLSGDFGGLSFEVGEDSKVKQPEESNMLELGKEERREVVELLKNNPDIYQLLRDIGPDMAALFWKEQTGDTIRDYAMINTELNQINSRIKVILEKGLENNPVELQTLLVLASEKKLLEQQAFFAVKSSLKGYASKKFWGDWGNDIISWSKNLAASATGARGADSDDPGERFINRIDHETTLRDIIDGGQNELAKGLRGTVAAYKSVSRNIGYGKKIILETRKALNETLGKIIPERDKYQDKINEMTIRLARVDSRIEDLNESLSTREETREQAEERLRKTIEELEFDESTRRSFTLNLVNEMTFRDPRTKTELIAEYDTSGFTPRFADLLYSAIEYSKLVAQRERMSLSERISEIEQRIRELERSEETMTERAVESVEFSEEAYLSELREKLEKDQRKYIDYEGKINKSVLDQIRALNGKVEEDVIKNIRRSLA